LIGNVNVFFLIFTSSDPLIQGYGFTNEFCVLVATPDDTIMIGEVFVDGQNKDVWCISKTPINDVTMYGAGGGAHLTDPQYATIPSCYVLYRSAGYVTNIMYLLLRPSSECLSSSPTVGDYLLCE
jgi:hypothetical protein